MIKVLPYLVLIAMGAGWGITQPLSKISVMGGLGHFGMIFWQLIIGVIVLGAIQTYRRRRLSFATRTIFFYLLIACIGTIIPNTASYQAIAVLPSGIVSILLSFVPIMAFPIALLLCVDTFSFRRLVGLGIGLVAVLLIVGVPSALADRSMLWFVPLALVAPAMYAFEGNFVAKWGTGGTGPLQLLLGASAVGAVIALPLAVGSGQFINPFLPWGAPEWALVASSIIHAAVYTTYVAMIRAYGPVFSVQVSYLVTAFGVFWAMLLLNESYSGPIWLALGLLFVGIYFVNPKVNKTNALAPNPD